MSKQQWWVVLAGIVTSVATAFGITLVYDLIGLNFFTFSIWVLVPAGAVACGFAAASGYFFAAKYLHVMPSNRLLAQMAVVAAVTQLLIYWLEYETAVVDGQNVSSLVPFWAYLNVILTKTHYMLGRAGQIDTGEVGSFGYFMALLQFLGFVAGGIFLYFKLLDEPACISCRRYLQTIAKKEDSFDDLDSFAAYYDAEFQHPVDSPEFAQHVGTDYTGTDVKQGAMRLETLVLSCPTCGEQSVSERAWIFNGREWKDLDEAHRVVPIPEGVNVAPCYANAR